MSIGLEVAIEKRHESEVSVTYAFFVREGRGGIVVLNPTGRVGLVELLKMSGDITQQEACPDDFGGGVILSRVMTVLKRHWKAGEYPAITWWAG